VVECAPIDCSACTAQVPSTLPAGEIGFAWVVARDGAGSELSPAALADGLCVSLQRQRATTVEEQGGDETDEAEEQGADSLPSTMASTSTAPTTAAAAAAWTSARVLTTAPATCPPGWSGDSRTHVLTTAAALSLFHSPHAWQTHHAPTAPRALCVALRSLEAGPHLMHVTLRGVPIGRSPFPIEVLAATVNGSMCGVRLVPSVGAFTVRPIHSPSVGARVVIAGEPVTLLLTSRDSFGNRCMRGGHAVRVLVRSSRRVLEAAVLDVDDGTYEASFSCVDAGPLQLAMSVEGRAVPSAEAMRIHVAAAAPHSLHLAPCAPAVRSLFDTSVPPTTAPIGWSGLPWNSSLGSIMEPSAETLFPHGRLRLVSGVEDLSDWGPGSGSAALGSGAPRTPSTVIDAMVDASSRALPLRAVPRAPSVRAVPVGRPCFFELRATDAYGNPCELTPEMVDVSASSSAVPSAEEMEVVVITDETPPPLDHPGCLRARVRVTALAARRHTLVARCAGLEASVGVEGVSVNAAVSDAPTPNGIEP